MDKRGISPLLATVLIIGVTIVIAVIIITFLNTTVESEIERAGEETSQLDIVNFDASADNVHGRTVVEIQNNENQEIGFVIQTENGAVTDALVDAYSKGVFEVEDYSENARITPVVNGKAYSGQAITEEATFAGSSNDNAKNYALEFDGSNNYIKINNDADPTGFPGDEVTVEFWIKPIDNDKSQYIFEYGDGSSNKGWAVFLRSSTGSRELVYRIYGSAGNIDKNVIDIIDFNKWQHFAVVFDKNANVIFYKNGTLISGPNTILSWDVPSRARVGYSDEAPDTYFEGQMDEVRIWKELRTQEQIQANMNRELSGTESNLAGYWNFNEGSGNLAYDQTSNGNNGNIQNNPTWKPAYS